MPETIYEMCYRMCQSNSPTVACENCPLVEGREHRRCIADWIANHDVDNVEDQLDIVRKWAEEHPVKAYVKTYKDVLLERLPSVAMLEDDVPCICRNAAFGIDKVCFDILLGTQKCKDCWNEPYKEE